MSGMHTGGRVLVVRADHGMDVEAYRDELDCVKAMINNGSLGKGVEPGLQGWGSEAHAAAVDQAIAHAQHVRREIAKEQARERRLASEAPPQ